MKAVLAQIAPKLGRLEDNLELHRKVVAEAWADRTDLVVFPELGLTGYLLRDYVPQVALPSTQLPELLAGLGDGREQPLDVVVGYVELSPGRQCFNSAAYLHLPPGATPELVAVHRKVHLPTYGMFDERRYLSSGQTVRAFESRVLGRTGMLICEDLWHPSSVYVLSVDGPRLEGVQSILGIANSPARGAHDPERFSVSNVDTWQRINALHAQLFGLLVFHCQRVGVEDSYIYSGGSEVIAPSGQPLARAPLFEETLLTVELGLDDELRWHRSVKPLEVADDFDLVRRELSRITAEAFR